jgi:hypothetical protein
VPVSRSSFAKAGAAAALLLVVLASAPTARAVSPAPVAAAPRAPHPIPSADLDPFPEGPVPPGAWSESTLYRFRLERIERCGADGMQRAGALKGEASWVGVYVTVEAKQPKVFASPRDLELRRGGVILPATFVNLPDLPGCKPVLKGTRLRPAGSAAGFALFAVPKTFRIRTDDPIVLSYRPTRWGGARRAEVPIPECFDACVKPWQPRESAAPARGAVSVRRDSRKR